MSEPYMNFIEWLFVDHWLFSTFFMPFLAMLYAIFTEQTAWALCAGAWGTSTFLLGWTR